MSVPAFEFDRRRAVAFDVEAYPGRWLVGFYGRDRRGETRVSRVVDGDRAALERTLTQLAQRHKGEPRRRRGPRGPRADAHAARPTSQDPRRL